MRDKLFEKALKVIDSCKTNSQFEAAERYLSLLSKKASPEDHIYLFRKLRVSKHLNREK
jgi:hypothetical protein